MTSPIDTATEYLRQDRPKLIPLWEEIAVVAKLEGNIRIERGHLDAAEAEHYVLHRASEMLDYELAQIRAIASAKTSQDMACQTVSPMVIIGAIIIMAISILAFIHFNGGRLI